jgi:hypothetical protein
MSPQSPDLPRARAPLSTVALINRIRDRVVRNKLEEEKEEDKAEFTH